MSGARIPNEIIFNISQFGQTFPGLSPEYILREVANVSQSRPFDWSSELLLEQFRSQNQAYQLLGDVLKSIPQRVISQVNQTITQQSPLLIIPVHDLNRLEQQRIIDQAISSGLNVDTDNTSIYVRLPHMFNSDEFSQAVYLAHPRTNNELSTWRSVTYGMDSGPFPGNEIPKVLNRQRRGNTSDLNIVRSILSLNPRYDIGELLSWLEYRENVCEHVRENGLEHLASINAMMLTVYPDLGQYSLYLWVDERDVDRITQWLDSLRIGYNINVGLGLGPRSEIITIEGMLPYPMQSPQVRSQAEARLDIVRSLITDFLSVRMCNVSYATRISEVHNS